MRPQAHGVGVALSHRRGGRGLTLLELMATMAFVVILLAVGIPSMEEAALNAKLRGQANAFLTSLHLARGEAIKRNGRVVVCRSADGASCATSGGWEQGWILFHDCDNDAVRDTTDVCRPVSPSTVWTPEPLIERTPALATGFLLRGGSNVDSYISFSPTGTTLLTTGAFQSGSVTLCRELPSVATKSKQIVISAVGRVRICDRNPISACPPSSLAADCQ